MSVTITVDLANSTPGDIAKAAKFMLLFAGYDESTGRIAAMPSPQSTDEVRALAAAAGVGQFVDPTSAFAAGVGSNLTARVEMPLHPSIVAGLVPPVPTAPPVAPPPPPPGIEVDAQGVPWDVRIHSGSRAKVQDGTWRQKRNLDQAVLKAVMDELRHTMNVERRAPQPPAPPAPQQVFAPVPVVPPIPVVPPAPPNDEDPHVMSAANGVPPAPFVTAAVPPAPPAAATTSAPTPPSAGAAPSASLSNGVAPTFPQLMQKITAGFHAKTITQADITRAVQAVGLTALPMLAARPDLVPAVATELGVAL